MSDPAPPSGPSAEPLVLAPGLEPAGQARHRAPGPVPDRRRAGRAAGGRPGRRGRRVRPDRAGRVDPGARCRSWSSGCRRSGCAPPSSSRPAAPATRPRCSRRSPRWTRSRRRSDRSCRRSTPDDPAVVGAHRQAEQALALLPAAARSGAEARTRRPPTAVARYSEVIDAGPAAGQRAAARGEQHRGQRPGQRAGRAVRRPATRPPCSRPLIAAATAAREPDRCRAGRAAGQRGPAGDQPEQLPHRAGHRPARPVRGADRRPGEHRPQPPGRRADRRRPGAPAARRHRGARVQGLRRLPGRAGRRRDRHPGRAGQHHRGRPGAPR